MSRDCYGRERRYIQKPYSCRVSPLGHIRIHIVPHSEIPGSGQPHVVTEKQTWMRQRDISILTSGLKLVLAIRSFIQTNLPE